MYREDKRSRDKERVSPFGPSSSFFSVDVGSTVGETGADVPLVFGEAAVSLGV